MVLGAARPFGRTAAAGPGVSHRFVAVGFLRRFGFIPACARLFRSSIGFRCRFVLPMRRPARVCLVAPRPLISAVELAATGIRIRPRHRCVREFMVASSLGDHFQHLTGPDARLAGHGSLVATAPGSSLRPTSSERSIDRRELPDFAAVIRVQRRRLEAGVRSVRQDPINASLAGSVSSCVTNLVGEQT